MMFISVESGAGGLRRGSDLGMCREVKRGLSGRKSGFNPANRNSDDSERFLRSFCRFCVHQSEAMVVAVTGGSAESERNDREERREQKGGVGTSPALVKSTFARACAAVRSFYKNQKPGKNSSGIAEITTGKVLLRGEI